MTPSVTRGVLALNAGSSSVKVALSPDDAQAGPLLTGSAERLGSDAATLRLRLAGDETQAQPLGPADHADALGQVFDAVDARFPGLKIAAIGHRIVHGGAGFRHPVRVTPAVHDALAALVPLAPLHQPHGLAGIASAERRFPDAVQIACFDTAFHADKPWVHDAFALPRRFHDAGVRRYGFHGIACESVCAGLRARGVPLDSSRIVIAHLGNGCSVTAVQNGRAVATSMGFSALDGLVMGTRCGRIDPGVLLHLMREGHDAAQIERLLYRDSGLLALSGVSNDMRDIVAADTEEARAAVAYFVARAVEEICRLAGAMGGLDTVVFSGGIGENADDIRQAIMAKLAFLPGATGQGVGHLVQPADEERQLLRAAVAR